MAASQHVIWWEIPIPDHGRLQVSRLLAGRSLRLGVGAPDRNPLSSSPHSAARSAPSSFRSRSLTTPWWNAANRLCSSPTTLPGSPPFHLGTTNETAPRVKSPCARYYQNKRGASVVHICLCILMKTLCRRSNVLCFFCA
jgi:hypothetical protein